MPENILILLLAATGAGAQVVDEFSPPRANCCLQNSAQNLAGQLQDRNQLGRYRADNQRLKALP